MLVGPTPAAAEDTARDRELQADVAGVAQAQLEARGEHDGQLLASTRTSCTGAGSETPRSDASADRSPLPGARLQPHADAHVGVRRQPDPRQRRQARMRERAQDAPGRRDEERVTAAPEDEYRPLGPNRDPKRVREGAVVVAARPLPAGSTDAGRGRPRPPAAGCGRARPRAPASLRPGSAGSRREHRSSARRRPTSRAPRDTRRRPARAAPGPAGPTGRSGSAARPRTGQAASDPCWLETGCCSEKLCVGQAVVRHAVAGAPLRTTLPCRQPSRACCRALGGRHPPPFAAGRMTPTTAAARSGPRNRTSCSSTTPNRSCTRRRASTISAMASAEVAPPAFSMKFAWTGEIRAPPLRWPFRPHSSSIRPAPSSCAGFLKTLPNVRRFVGCVALRCASSSATRAFTTPAGRGSSAKRASGDDLPGPEARVAIRQPELGRRAACGCRRRRRPSRRRAPRAIRGRTRPRSCGRRRRPFPGWPTRTRAHRDRQLSRGGGRPRSSPRPPR